MKREQEIQALAALASRTEAWLTAWRERPGLPGKPFIEISGPQGAGKSTLARLLAERLGAFLYPEPYEAVIGQLEQLNMLRAKIFTGEATMAERKKNSTLTLEVELHILAERRKEAKRLPEQLRQGPVVWDGGLRTDIVYPKTFHDLGLLFEKDLDTYLKEFKKVFFEIPQPDVVAWLKVSPRILLRRWRKALKKEGKRDFEAATPPFFLSRMAELSNELLRFGVKRGWPVPIVNFDPRVPINTNVTNFADNGYHKEQVVDQVMAKIVESGLPFRLKDET